MAIKYYMFAARNGSVEALYELGICCYHENGVKQNKQMVEQLIALASGHGHDSAGREHDKLFKLKLADKFMLLGDSSNNISQQHQQEQQQMEEKQCGNNRNNF